MIFKIFGYVLLTVGVSGFCLNLLVIILMVYSKQVQTYVHFTLFNLIFSDFAVSILGLPLNIIATFNEGWIFRPGVCLYYGFVMALLGIVSITTLTVLSFERYMLVLNPLHSFNIAMRKYIAYVIAGIWIYSLSLTTPPLFGWGEYAQEGLNISCSVNWESRNPSVTSYIIFLFISGFFVPVSVIIYSYYNVLMITKKNSKLVRGKVAKIENKVSLMIFIMIVAFLFAWTPYAIMALLKQFAYNFVHISPEMASIPAVIAKSSICYNPIIYVFMNRQILHSIRNEYQKSRTSCDISISNRRLLHKTRCSNNVTVEKTIASGQVEEFRLTEV